MHLHLNQSQNRRNKLQSWNNPALFVPKKGNDKMLYEINLSVRGQELKSTSKKMASNTVNEVRCHFSFEGEEWEVDVKRAVFSNDRGKRYSVVIADDTCFVPHEVLLDRGAVTVNVVGATMNGDDLVERITTYKTIIIENTQKVYTDGLNSTNPTPSEFEQFVEAVKGSASVTKVGDTATITITDKDGTTTVEIYDGEDGDDGYTPQKGTDYWTAQDKAEIVADTEEAVEPYVDTKVAQGVALKQDKLTAGSLVDITNNTISIDITSITNSEIDAMFE